MLQRTMFEQQKIDLSSAPWTMHEFFAGSGLVAYGLKGMFAPVWANDISEQKATVYEVSKIFEDMIYRTPICRGPAFPARICHWLVRWAVSMRREADLYGNGCVF